MSNKIPKADLEAFQDYCTQNPEAQKSVNTVIQAFSPDSIGEFIKNCKKTPLPTDAASYEVFCLEYEDQLRNVQEAPKQETSETSTKQNQQENSQEQA